MSSQENVARSFIECWNQQAALKQPKKKLDESYRPICDWIEGHYFDVESVIRTGDQWDFRGARLLKLEPFQRAILEHCFTPDKDGYFPYREILWSQIKKSGKSATGAAVGSWWASCIEPPNLVICAASDKEQSAGRIFAAMGPTLYNTIGKFPGDHSIPSVRLPNGTVVKAIPKDYAGEAGAMPGLTLWTELWAMESERDHRLFEELIPVLSPTRKNSVRFVETYAGFEDQSTLLLQLFLRFFKATDEKELQPEAELVKGLIDPTTGEQLPCYRRKDLGAFLFWDHARRMPWQKGKRGQEYYDAEKKKNEGRMSTYIRHHENRWQSSEGGFLDPAWIKRSIHLTGPKLQRMVLAADAAVSGDNLALIGMVPVSGVTSEGNPCTRYQTGFAEIWEATKGDKFDLDETIGARIEWLHERDLILGPVFYDPYQLHQVMLNLNKKGIEVEDFPQGTMRLQADTFLQRCYRDDLIDNWEYPLLLQNLAAARAREDTDGRLRIVKAASSSAKKGSGDAARFKVDGAVAQSMAVFKASLIEPDVAPYSGVITRSTMSVIGVSRY